MNENVERTRQIKYQLYSRPLGSLDLLQEPRGSANDTKSYTRDKDSRGFTVKTNINLQFFAESSEWLSYHFRQYGIKEKVFLTKYVKDKTALNEKWKLRYIQELKIGSWHEISRTLEVTVDPVEGGLFSDMKNRLKDKYNIIAPESADGVNIGALQTYPFIPQPRGIFFQSLMRDNNAAGYRINSDSIKTGVTDSGRTIPLKNIYISDTQNTQVPFNSGTQSNEIRHELSRQIGDIQNLGDFFYWRSDIRRTIRVKLDLEFSISQLHRDDVTGAVFQVELRKTELVGEFDELKTAEVLLTFNALSAVGVDKVVAYDENILLEEGESLSFVFTTFTQIDTDWIDDFGHLFVYTSVTKSEVTVEDQTDYQVTQSRCLKPFDLFERLIAKITGKTGLFRSSVFGPDGEYEHMVCDNGFWARGFPDEITDDLGEIRAIQFNTSFKEAFESYNYLEPLAWFVELEGNTEVIRMEKATYTMQNFIGLSLSAVDKIKHEGSEPDFFSKIIIGHKKSLEFEEINSGIDEPNGKSELTTFIPTNDSTYFAESEFRFDAVPYELTRRITYAQFPREDTERDDNKWIHDAKVDSTGTYTHNLWQQRFDSAPTGIFDPDTAWNLWLSPMNRLFYGHGYSVKRGLYHYPGLSIRFNSSNANQNLKTVIGGFELAENGSILISNIEKPRVEAEKTNFTFKMTQAIEDTLAGFTEVNGILVPNIFGLIEYPEKGELRYGRLTKVEGDEESKMSLQNARL